ncbi:MAG: MarR family transcriptional regulator [Oscillospiraceae bacterium]|nr:MarR family transcriptional regulator [Oscillospiraceae bacterium]
MDGQGIGVRLRMLNNAIRRYVERYSPKSELDHLTCSNGWIIGYIDDAGGSVFQQDLESEFGITRSTVSKVIILLEKKGMLKRESVPHDARLKRIKLTEKSTEVLKIMREDKERMEARLTKGFTPQELETLYGFFDRIQSNLDEAQKEQTSRDID